MNVSLTPELENFVKAKVATGMYTSVSEVMREALRMMEERDSLKSVKLERLREDIGKGLESVNKGHTRPLDIDAIKKPELDPSCRKRPICVEA